jgi:CheY-like chemotaxis protein
LGVGGAPNRAGRVALLVESDPAIAETILRALAEEDLPCQVVLAHDGPEALDYLLGRGDHARRDTAIIMPCVILLDLSSLPRRSGPQVLRGLRAAPETKLVPVVAFSSSSSSSEEHREASAAIYASGANSYIGGTSGWGSLAETLGQVAHYWLVLNEPPPTL